LGGALPLKSSPAPELRLATRSNGRQTQLCLELAVKLNRIAAEPCPPFRITAFTLAGRLSSIPCKVCLPDGHSNSATLRPDDSAMVDSIAVGSSEPVGKTLAAVERAGSMASERRMEFDLDRQRAEE
jgi:hypothetical protein